METKISKTTSTRKRSNLEQELVSLQQGQLIWVTKDFLSLGIYQARFFSRSDKASSQIWVVDGDATDEDLRKLTYERGEKDLFKLNKPDWHSSPMDAWNQIITLTFREQVRLLEAQQRAAKQLFGDKD